MTTNPLITPTTEPYLPRVAEDRLEVAVEAYKAAVAYADKLYALTGNFDEWAHRWHTQQAVANRLRDEVLMPALIDAHHARLDPTLIGETLNAGPAIDDVWLLNMHAQLTSRRAAEN